jgi:tol-pal system protein YbgF
MVKYLTAAILGMAASVSLAQVRVIDSQPMGSATPPPPAPVASRASQAQSAPSDRVVELYYQLQTLQQEVQQLRGLVEEQAHELKRLKQQHMDDYLDLDRRISQGGNAGAGEPSASASGATPGDQNELAAYRTAIDLVLKQQDYDGGIVALEKYLANHPNGRYAPNAKYWLGQIYLLKNQLEQSRQWFVSLLDDHPKHQKAPEAKFKLGKVYHLLGDNAQARKLLEEVAGSNTSAASLARDYLRQNFAS